MATHTASATPAPASSPAILPGSVPTSADSGGLFGSGWFWLLLFLLVAVVLWFALFPPMAAAAEIRIGGQTAVSPVSLRGRGKALVRAAVPVAMQPGAPPAEVRLLMWAHSQRKGGMRTGRVRVLMLMSGGGAALAFGRCTIRRGQNGYLCKNRVLVEIWPLQ